MSWILVLRSRFWSSMLNSVDVVEDARTFSAGLLCQLWCQIQTFSNKVWFVSIDWWWKLYHAHTLDKCFKTTKQLRLTCSQDQWDHNCTKMSSTICTCIVTRGGNGIGCLFLIKITKLSQPLTLINDYFFRNVLTVLTSMMGIQSMT